MSTNFTNEIYKYEEKSGANCCYCFCPPTKNTKLGDYNIYM